MTTSLTDLETLCFNCPLPDCDIKAKDCLWPEPERPWHEVSSRHRPTEPQPVVFDDVTITDLTDAYTSVMLRRNEPPEKETAR